MDDYGRAEIKFGTSDKTKIGSMMYAALMYKAGTNLEELADHVVHRLENGDVIFNVQTPDKGEYVLRLFFRRDVDKGKGEEFCDYFLISNQIEKNGKFPKGFQNRLGAKMPAFASSGLRPVKTSGYVRADNEEVKFGFYRDEDIELSVNLSGEKIKPSDAPLLLSQKEKEELVEYTVRYVAFSNAYKTVDILGAISIRACVFEHCKTPIPLGGDPSTLCIFRHNADNRDENANSAVETP